MKTSEKFRNKDQPGHAPEKMILMDARTLEELYRVCIPKLRVMAYKYVKDEELAKSIARDVFIEFFRDGKHLEGHSSSLLMKELKRRCNS